MHFASCMFAALVFSLTCVAILLLVIWRLSMFPCCVNGMSGLLNVIANGDSFAAAIIWNFVVFVLIFQRFSISLMLFIGFVSLQSLLFSTCLSVLLFALCHLHM